MQSHVCLCAPLPWVEYMETCWKLASRIKDVIELMKLIQIRQGCRFFLPKFSIMFDWFMLLVVAVSCVRFHEGWFPIALLLHLCFCCMWCSVELFCHYLRKRERSSRCLMSTLLNWGGFVDKKSSVLFTDVTFGNCPSKRIIDRWGAPCSCWWILGNPWSFRIKSYRTWPEECIREVFWIEGSGYQVLFLSIVCTCFAMWYDMTHVGL